MQLNDFEHFGILFEDEEDNENAVANKQFCGICGEAHKFSDCSLVETKSYVSDTYVPPKARLSLPPVLRLESMADQTFAILAKTPIEAGTTFGPLVAGKTYSLNPNIALPLRIFSGEADELIECYLNTADEYGCNWMMFVQPAQTLDEQNLMCYQESGELYFVAMKDIAESDVLKVWYAPYYAKIMKKDVLMSREELDVIHQAELMDKQCTELEVDELLKQQQHINRDSWICKVCGKVEQRVTKFAKHMLEHYTVVIKRNCPICNKAFKSIKEFSRHLKTVHNAKSEPPASAPAGGENPVKASPKSSKSLGGPLLNNFFTETLDNVNLLAASGDLSLDFENLNVGSCELDDFNFELGESKEQLVCDICLRPFGKLKHLVLHLKGHTGNFVCNICTKVFRRKENLKTHKCNVGASTKYECVACAKKFVSKKHFVRHQNAIHEEKFTCRSCGFRYYSQRELDRHKCAKASVPLEENTVLRKPANKTAPKRETVICEVCSEQFTSRKFLRQHMRIHSKPDLTCQFCDKKFHRKEVLQNHEKTHTGSAVDCPTCNKTLTHKTFSLHKCLHKSNKKYTCNQCDQPFLRSDILERHKKRHKLKECATCAKTFQTHKELKVHVKTHLAEYYVCPVCNKAIKLRASLNRHVKRSHPDANISEILFKLRPVTKSDDVENIAMNEVEKLLNENVSVSNGVSDIGDLSLMNTQHLENIVHNFENIINNMCDGVGPKDSTVDFGDLDMDFNLHQNLPSTDNQEVCLSMPDLTEDTEIPLGNNAFMTDNGTIIDQKDQDNVLVYVL